MSEDARRLLLVEDNPLDVELCLAALIRCGWDGRVDVARDGAEALNYLRRTGRFNDRGKSTPVAVLLDMKLPKVDGLQVLAAAKGDPALMGIPIVMLTASREPDDVQRSYDNGVNAYVVKPLGFAALASAVEQIASVWGRLNVVSSA